MAGVTVRDAHTVDLGGLMAIRYADHPAIHRDRLRDAAAQHLRFLIAERAETIIGFGLLVFTRPATWPDAGTTDRLPQVVDLYVTEALRDQGIGTLIIRRMEELAVSAGHNDLFLGVDPKHNPSAYALYVRLGYQPLQSKAYQDHWRFTDSDGNVHEGNDWNIDMVKTLRQPPPASR